MLNRWEAIIWIKVGLVYWHIYMHHLVTGAQSPHHPHKSNTLASSRLPLIPSLTNISSSWHKFNPLMSKGLDCQDKSNVKRRNTLGCLDQNMYSVETVKQSGPRNSLSTCKGWRPWNSQACEVVQVLMALWWLHISSSGETRKFDYKVKFDLEDQGHLSIHLPAPKKQ